MFRPTHPDLVRYVVLTWTADGGAVTKALSQLGFKTYSLRQMLALKENGKRHPQLWANMLRPKDEFFEAQSAPFVPGNRELTSKEGEEGDDKTRVGAVQQRLESFNKMALRLGIQSTKKLDVKDLADYDVIAGLPVSAIPPAELQAFFPKYTKFILVEGQQNGAEWCDKHVESGMVPVLTALRAVTGEEGKPMNDDGDGDDAAGAEGRGGGGAGAALKRRGPKASASPTAKVWMSLFRHFAWPGSGAEVLDTIPHEKERANVQSGFAGSPIKAAMSMVSSATKDDGREVLTRVGDIRAVEARRKLATEALAAWERDVKGAIPDEQLFVFRDGVDAWPELCFMVNKADAIEEKQKKQFPQVSYGTEYLAYLRRQIARADAKMKMANIFAACVLCFVLWQLNSVIISMGTSLFRDARRAVEEPKAVEKKSNY